MRLPSDEVGGYDAAPDGVVQDAEELEEGGWDAGQLHEDGRPDHVVERNAEVDDSLAFGHHLQRSDGHVSSLKTLV